MSKAQARGTMSASGQPIGDPRNLIDTERLEAWAAQSIKDDQIGAPRFLRCVAVGDQTQTGAARKELLRLATVWFGAEAERVDSPSSPSAAATTELARWADGAGALLVIGQDAGSSLPHPAAPNVQLDLLLIGSRGAITFEGVLQLEDGEPAAAARRGQG